MKSSKNTDEFVDWVGNCEAKDFGHKRDETRLRLGFIFGQFFDEILKNNKDKFFE